MRNNKLIISAVSVIVLMFLVSGCTSKVKIRASDQIFTDNHVSRIAIFSEGKVQWPGLGKGGPYIILPSCLQANENILTKTTQVLKDKGYEVVCAEPVGIAYNCKSWWYLEDIEARDDESAYKQIEDVKPTFIYPKFRDASDYNKALHNVINDMEAAILSKSLSSFAPHKSDIEVLHRETGADTICLQRVYGVKYSTARKVGSVIAGVALSLLSPGAFVASPNDRVEAFYIFVDATTGNVLWQHGLYTTGNPLDPDQSYVENVLQFFPAKNMPFDDKVCVKGEDGLYYCQEKGE